MKIQLSKFGRILISRPAGKEAFLVIKAYFKPKDPKEIIELDFTGVDIMGPSWMDEVLSGLKGEYGDERVKCLPSDNESVKASLKTIMEEN